MTGYHISIGYNGATGVDSKNAWRELVEAARKIADNPDAIEREALRLGVPEADDYNIKEYTAVYRGLLKRGASSESCNHITSPSNPANSIHWSRD